MSDIYCTGTVKTGTRLEHILETAIRLVARSDNADESKISREKEPLVLEAYKARSGKYLVRVEQQQPWQWGTGCDSQDGWYVDKVYIRVAESGKKIVEAIRRGVMNKQPSEFEQWHLIGWYKPCLASAEERRLSNARNKDDEPFVGPPDPGHRELQLIKMREREDKRRSLAGEKHVYDALRTFTASYAAESGL